MNYESIKNMPASRDGKMVYGMVVALVARVMLNQGIAILPQNPDGALFAFLICGVLVFNIGLAMVRFDTGRPLFEPLARNQ